MNRLLVIRDAVRAVYAKYGAVIGPLSRAVLAFLMLVCIQNHIGFEARLSKPLVLCAAAVLCGVFPGGFTSFVCALFIIADMFKVSAMLAGFGAALSLLVFILYFGYRPGAGILISLIPLMFYFKLPFLPPLLLGLILGFHSAVPAALGVLAWYVIRYSSLNADALAAAAGGDMAEELIGIATAVLQNSSMYLCMLGFALCIAVVALVSRSSMDYGRIIAVSAGAVVLAAVLLLGGGGPLTGSVLSDMLSLIVSYVIAAGYVMLFYGVDLKKTEHLSYEDDDYYYYVKAVPKLKARQPEETSDFL